MDKRIPVDEATSLAWAQVAHTARLAHHMLKGTPGPAPNSHFTQINALYPHEKASDWHRSYLTAALDHLLIWANIVAPLKFHPEHEVTHAFRPAFTLARAAIEASSQAVWMTSGRTAKECTRRHLALIRWDYEEHRKSVTDAEGKKFIIDMDARLIRRASDNFPESTLKKPNHLTVLRAAAPEISFDPDVLEGIWRAASGSAHGKAWPALSLQHVVPVDEYEPGQFRTIRFPDAEKMTEVLNVASEMTMHGVLRHADFCKADISDLMQEARLWLASVAPFRDDADPTVLAHLNRRN